MLYFETFVKPKNPTIKATGRIEIVQNIKAATHPATKFTIANNGGTYE